MTATYRDLLLMMTNYPQATPEWAIVAADALAAKSEATLSAVLCDVHLPHITNWLADKLARANEMIAEENLKGRHAARQLLTLFADHVPAERRGTELVLDSTSLIDPAALVHEARCRDLTIVPVMAELEYRAAAEALLFDSGRPVLLLPEHADATNLTRSIAIAWDGGRAASRAVADAMPLLLKAGDVRIITISKDKALPSGSDAHALAAHLRRHGLAPIIDEVVAAGRNAGEALMKHAADTGCSMLVMGGFGHSRARDFVLGGATKAVMDRPALATLLSH